MLGSGDAEYENAMRAAEAEHPASFRGWVGFSVPVAHRIIAGARTWLSAALSPSVGMTGVGLRRGVLHAARSDV